MTEDSKPPVMPFDASAAITKQARYRSEINQLFAADHAAHNWYRFVLSFPPHLVRDYLQRFGLTPQQRVLDPFCGTGTTVVECKKQGIPSVGVEANPMAYFAGRVKVNWCPNPDRLLDHAMKVAKTTLAELDAAIAPECLRSLNDEQAKLILKNSISPLPLHKTLVLLDHLQRQAHELFDDHERLALAKSIVSSISNLQFGP